MKSLNSVTALLIAATLLVIGGGCKHAPAKPPTPIPQMTSLPPGNNTDTGGPIRPVSNPTKGTGTDNPNPGGKLPGDGDGAGKNLGNNGDGGTTGKPLPPQFDPNKPNALTERPAGVENREALAAETVYFDYDKNTVKPSEVPKIQRVAAYLKNNAGANLRIEGNCDERGTEEYNRSLGERRALAIRELLMSEGVAAERVTTLSYGEDKPADQGHDEAAWSKNRRGDFVVLQAPAIQ